MIGIQMGKIQKHIGMPGRGHLPDNGLTDHIAWCQFSPLIVVGHETFAIAVDQMSTFTTNSLGDQGT